MNSQKQFNFFKTLAFMVIVFIVVVIIVEALFSLFSEAGIEHYLQNFTYPTIIKFGVSKLVGGLVYGVIMAFILKNKAKKKAGK